MGSIFPYTNGEKKQFNIGAEQGRVLIHGKKIKIKIKNLPLLKSGHLLWIFFMSPQHHPKAAEWGGRLVLTSRMCPLMRQNGSMRLTICAYHAGSRKEKM